MAVKRSDSPIEPMDLADMRANGARSTFSAISAAIA
jgi:hypothetical protein